MNQYIKFPRTFHFNWSESVSSNDKRHLTIDQFKNKEVIGTIKRDGENTSCYTDYLHARSIDSKDHESRHWMKQYHNTFKNNIPENWIVCGENLFAKHSILYNNLKTYFEVFAIFDNERILLSWQDIEIWCELLNLTHVPVFYKGIFDIDKINSAYEEYKNNSLDPVEGYVIRLSNSFPHSDYSKYTGKYVRANHIQTDNHWLHSKIIQNKIK